jgi:2-polyprenyl-3-methyl-5-hydroxy-6-metoxy-1,4-benzoquinol methylase
LRQRQPYHAVRPVTAGPEMDAAERRTRTATPAIAPPGLTSSASFRRRENCISCGSAALEPIWSGRFSDPPVRDWLEGCGYNADIGRLLGDQEFVRVQCSTCSVTFHQSILEDEWLDALYSEWIDEHQVEATERRLASQRPDPFEVGRQRIKHALRLRRLLGRGSPRPALLDFGCGDGEFVAQARLLGFEAVGVDSSASRTERAASQGIRIFPSLLDADVALGRPLDAVTLFQVLEHVAAPVELLGALGERMRPGGVLVVEVPNCEGIVTPSSPAELDALDPLEHINHFTPRTLRDMVARAGFSPVRRIPAHATTSLAQVVKSEASRLLGHGGTNQYFRRD